MRRIAEVGALVVALLLAFGNVVASAGPGGETIRSISHTLDLGGVDSDGSGEIGDAIADGFTSVSEMRAEDDETVVGLDRVTCSMSSVELVRWNCFGTTTFDEAGDISYQGSFRQNEKSVMSITGGTGDYRDASGWVVFKPLPGDDFPYSSVYHVIP